MPRPDVGDVLSVVMSRSDLLDAVGTDGVRKGDLRDRLSVSRSTIDRGIRELEEAGLVEQTAEGYRRTLSGELALTEYERFIDRVDGVVDAGDVLEALPFEFELDPVVLEDASVASVTAHRPYEPVSVVDDLLGRAKRLDLFLPVLPEPLLESLERHVLGQAVPTRFVVADPALDRLMTGEGTGLSDALAAGDVELTQSSDDTAYGLCIAETEDDPVVAFVVFEDEVVHGVITNDSEAAVTWADGTFTTIWEGATPLQATGD